MNLNLIMNIKAKRVSRQLQENCEKDGEKGNKTIAMDYSYSLDTYTSTG